MRVFGLISGFFGVFSSQLVLFSKFSPRSDFDFSLRPAFDSSSRSAFDFFLAVLFSKFSSRSGFDFFRSAFNSSSQSAFDFFLSALFPKFSFQSSFVFSLRASSDFSLDHLLTSFHHRLSSPRFPRIFCPARFSFKSFFPFLTTNPSPLLYFFR